MATTHSNLPEAVLIKRLKAGDEEAFQQLVQQYHAPMLRIATTIVPEALTAEDVVQEAWLAALKAIRSFEGRSSIKTWLFSIVLNLARTHLKREQRHERRAGVSLDGDETQLSEKIIAVTDNLPETVAVSHELQSIISRTIELLPYNQQSVIRLRQIEGFSALEVSQRLGISEINQRVLLHRARKYMRIRLLSY